MYHQKALRQSSLCMAASKGWSLQALKEASQQPADPSTLTQPHLSPRVTPSRPLEPSAEQQAILALTGGTKATITAAATASGAAAAPTAAHTQHEQTYQAIAAGQHALSESVLTLQPQQQQELVRADVADDRSGAVPRQLSRVFADEASEAGSVPEELDSASESIEVRSLNVIHSFIPSFIHSLLHIHACCHLPCQQAAFPVVVTSIPSTVYVVYCNCAACHSTQLPLGGLTGRFLSCNPPSPPPIPF